MRASSPLLLLSGCTFLLTACGCLLLYSARKTTKASPPPLPYTIISYHFVDNEDNRGFGSLGGNLTFKPDISLYDFERFVKEHKTNLVQVAILAVSRVEAIP